MPTPPEPYDHLLTLCEARRARRQFAPKPLAAAEIDKILAVARTSPYASGKKNWEVAVITDPAVLKRMAAAVKARSEALRARVRQDFADDFAAYASHFSTFAQAPSVFAPTFRIAPALSLMLEGETPQDAALRQWERDNYVKSISCAGMLILLAAESLGLAACYMTGPLLAEEELGRLMGIKQGRSIGALIPVGYRP